MVCDGLFPMQIGGMQKHSTMLARYLIRAGAELTLVHPHLDEEVRALFSDEICQPNLISVPWPASPTFPGHYLWKNYSYSVKARKVLLDKRHPPAPIYVQGFSGWKLVTDPLPGFPVLLNLHGLEMFQTLRGFRNNLQAAVLRQISRKLMRQAHGVVSLGGKLTEIISREAPVASIYTQPVGIEPVWCETVFRNSGKNRNFLFVGRYEWRKGIELLLEVIPKVLQVNMEAQFRFIGDIPTNLHFVHERVHFEGVVRDEGLIREFYSWADVLICPSWSEGMPTVINEAMASGLAIIASDVGGIAGQVDNSNGFLIKPGDIAALEAAILQCCRSEGAGLDRLRIRSREKVRELFWPRLVRFTLEDIQRLKH